MAGTSQQITELVADARRGDADATARLVPLLYDELRHIAAGLMAREHNAATLQPTALVHEAYLRLLGGGECEWQSPRISSARPHRRCGASSSSMPGDARASSAAVIASASL